MKGIVNKTIEHLLAETAEDFAEKVEFCSKAQFRELIGQMIESGDISRYIMNMAPGPHIIAQTMMYEPFKIRQELEAKIEELKCCVNCGHGIEREGGLSLVSYGCGAPFGTQENFTGTKCDGWIEKNKEEIDDGGEV